MSWKRFLPVLSWFPMRRDQIVADVLAGIALGLLLIPQSLAYAHLAGMPPVHGLYAAFLPLIFGAIFGVCGQLTTGPVAMTAILTAAVLAVHAEPGDPRWIALAAVLAILVGVIRIVLGLLRASFLVSLLSHPVMVGFTAAAACIIAESQIASLIGVEVGRSQGFFTHVAAIITHLTDLHWPTVAVGVGSLIALILLKRWFHRIPPILPVAAIGTTITWLCGYEAAGGRIVGELPSGLPPLGLSGWDWTLAWRMLPDALWITLIGFMEVLSITKSVEARTRQRIDLDQELIGQGMASLAAGVSAGFPVSGSLSRSAFNLGNGARTGFSSVIAAVLVVAALLVLGPVLGQLPLAVLAAAIIAAVVSLIDIPALRRAFRVHHHDGIAALVTFAATLAFAPRMIDGLLVGAALAIAFHLHRTMRPRVVELGRHGDGTFRDRVLHDLPSLDPAILVLRYDGRLYFANTAHFARAVDEHLATTPGAKWILLAGDGLNEVDATGAEALRDLHTRLSESGIGLAFVDLKAPVHDTLERAGLIALVGPESVFRTIDAALETLRDRLAPSDPPAEMRI